MIYRISAFLLLAVFILPTSCSNRHEQKKLLNNNGKQGDSASSQSEITNITYAALQQQVKQHFDLLLQQGMINKKIHYLITSTMLADIAYFEAHTDGETEKLITRLLNGLAKLKGLELDTEDSESIAEAYYVLSKKKSLHLNKELNKWLYDIEFE